MANEVTPTSLGTENVVWDLSVLYSGIDDPSLETDIATLELMAKEFNENFRGHLDERLEEALLADIKMDELRNKLFVYLFLALSVDQKRDDLRTRMQQYEQRMALASGQHMAFYSIELAAMTEESIAAQAEKSELVRKHLPYLADIRKYKKHMLTEEVESALAKRSPFDSGYWAKYADELEASMKFNFEGSQLSMEEILTVMSHDENSDRRAAALKTLNDTLSANGHAGFIARLLSQIALAGNTENSERGYAGPMTSCNMGNKLDDAVVAALHESVERDLAPLARRHYRLKAKLLGLQTLRWSDRNAPVNLASADPIAFDEAIRIVLAAYRSFSPTMADIAERQFKEKRVHAPAIPDKESGAYNYSIVIPSGRPITFTFLNYLGTPNDVMTLAHELGHGIHGTLAGEAQGVLMFRAPMAYAETASVFGEMTTYNSLRTRLLEAGDKKALLTLLMEKLDGIFNTTLRQISFSLFEQKFHGANRLLSDKELTAFWMEVTKRLYGEDGDVFTYENIENLWCYVSHFRRPFYVYSYAVGELFTQSIYAQQAKLGDSFENLYTDLLRAGGTKPATELLAPMGLNPSHADFWANGTAIGVKPLVEEAERLTAELSLS